MTGVAEYKELRDDLQELKQSHRELRDALIGTTKERGFLSKVDELLTFKRNTIKIVVFLVSPIYITFIGAAIAYFSK